VRRRQKTCASLSLRLVYFSSRTSRSVVLLPDVDRITYSPFTIPSSDFPFLIPVGSLRPRSSLPFQVMVCGLPCAVCGMTTEWTRQPVAS